MDADAALTRPLLDRGLLERAGRGDNVAFDRLLATRLDRLHRIARAILHDDSAAYDATQDACLRAWRQLHGLRDPDRFDSWLTQILVNRCRTELVRRRTTTVREVSIGPGGPDEREHATRGFADDLVQSESIRRAFRRMDADKRTLLVLHYVEALPVGEIAAVLGVPVGTVKWRLSRARSALERALEAER